MKKILFLTLLLLSVVTAKGYEPFISFSASESALIKIYAKHKKLPLSGASYIFNPYSCPVISYVSERRSPYKYSEEQRDIVWMHLVPEHVMGRGMECMREKVCRSIYKKRLFSGARCCRKRSEKFKMMSSDMFNIIPVMQGTKERRFERFFITLPEAGAYADTQVIPGESWGDIAHKGEIARSYLYLRNRYGLELNGEEEALFTRWHKKYPPSSWERIKNREIYKVQGTFNPYIEKL